MNHFILQQNAFFGREEMRGTGPTAAVTGPVAFVSDPRDPLVCPRPRRVGILSNNSIRPRFHLNQHSEFCDSKAGSDLLEMILMKENRGTAQCMSEVASSPPFYSGSPPSRASNPLVQDARFRDEKVAPFPIFTIPPPPLSSGLSSPSSSARKGGCARTNFGFKPAAIRVEGFDCLTGIAKTRASPQWLEKSGEKAKLVYI